MAGQLKLSSGRLLNRVLGCLIDSPTASTDVRSLDQVQLRVMNKEEATIRSGERYPIMTSSFSGLVNNSSSKNQTVPQVQYEDLGLTLKVRSQIESENEV
jgi:type II secretory pathway component GspD/PulD (secretin)